jgi:hypothetical protein
MFRNATWIVPSAAIAIAVLQQPQTFALYSEAATPAGPYSDLGSIGGAAPDMASSARGITLSAADQNRILQGMLTLPAHPDVREGLQTWAMRRISEASRNRSSLPNRTWGERRS